MHSKCILLNKISPSNPISEVLLARSNLDRSCDTGISIVTWPEVSSKTSAFSFIILQKYLSQKQTTRIPYCQRLFSKDLHALLDTAPV